MQKSLGENIAPILTEIENTLWEREANTPGEMVKWPASATTATLKIFMSLFSERMFEMQAAENMPLQQRGEMAEALGSDIKKLVFTYTGIDTHSLYK